ncbi:MAG: DUF1622 domain-containing protein [Methanoregula sp.]|jgi:uncharacterized membrane protein|uniref:DUF1622 domain-containing protein n=1 Tax=Methanoregula sp. TaxID=2052170 RepID=UPI003C1A9665
MDVLALPDIITFFSLLFGIAGAILIIYGGLRAMVFIVLREFRKTETTYTQIRRAFTSYLVFGLEFFIAADVLKTFITPSEQEIILLGAVVIIRTILGYFLSRESKEFELAL